MLTACMVSTIHKGSALFQTLDPVIQDCS